MNKTILTDKEWVENDLKKFKDFYKSPDKLADQMIELIKRVRDDKEQDDEQKWLLFGAVENAWTIMLWTQEPLDRVRRFFNTIKAYGGFV